MVRSPKRGSNSIQFLHFISLFHTSTGPLMSSFPLVQVYEYPHPRCSRMEARITCSLFRKSGSAPRLLLTSAALSASHRSEEHFYLYKLGLKIHSYYTVVVAEICMGSGIEDVTKLIKDPIFSLSLNSSSHCINRLAGPPSPE